jgi:tRNA(fMet)-specific endonuclease VapC
MGVYLLDTSVIIDILNDRRGRKGLLENLVLEGSTLACCAVNVAEVYSGMRAHEARITDALLRSFEYFEITWQVACAAGRLKYEHARKGQTLALADMLIAAVALAYNLTLITDNAKDFPMTDLKLLPLQSPAG